MQVKDDLKLKTVANIILYSLNTVFSLYLFISLSMFLSVSPSLSLYLLDHGTIFTVTDMQVKDDFKLKAACNHITSYYTP